MYIHTTALDINCIHVVNPKLVGREKKYLSGTKSYASQNDELMFSLQKNIRQSRHFLSRWQSRSCNEFPYGSFLIMWVY